MEGKVVGMSIEEHIWVAVWYEETKSLVDLTTTEPAQPEKWGCVRELNPVSSELTRPTYHQATATCSRAALTVEV